MRMRTLGGRAPAFSRPSAVGWLVVGLSSLMLVVAPSALFAAPEDQDVFEDFEGLSTSYGVPFVIGPSGSRAEFGGNARSTDIVGTTHSGTFAWTVRNAAADGTITFLDAPASVVEFYASAGSNPFGMIIRAYDPDGVQIGPPIVISTSAWTLVTFTGPVDHIDVSNGAAGDLVYVDDFGYTTGAQPEVPLLGTPQLIGFVLVLALIGWIMARGRRGALQH